MFMDRRYRFGDVYEKVYFSDFNKLVECQLVVFGDVHELVFFVMLMDSRYVVMQTNWPFLVTGESQ